MDLLYTRENGPVAGVKIKEHDDLSFFFFF